MGVSKVALLLYLFGASCSAVKLGMYNVEQDTITISGISSGGAMAMQYHISNSNYIKAAGIVAGLPYACARNGLTSATMCMSNPGLTNIQAIITLIRNEGAAGRVDNLSNLNGQKVWIFHGTRDSTVNPTNGVQIKTIYEEFGSQVTTEYTMAAVHGYPTNFYGAACGSSSSLTQYINNCNYHGAFQILNNFYNGTLTMPTGSETLTSLILYEQGEFGGSSTSSMDSTGFLYVPSGCQANAKKCRLHIALHGCQQYRGTVGDVFALKTGYIHVAEKNDIIIMFPQASSNILMGNPNGCWDWWGYLDAAFFNRNGGQMKAIHRMIERVAFCDGNSDCFDTPEDPPTTTAGTTTTPEPGVTTTPNPNQCSPNEVIFRPFPGDCTYYTMCACGANVLLQCAPGLYFDPSINNCNFMQLVDCPN